MKRIVISKRRLMGTLILSFLATYSQEYSSLSRVHTPCCQKRTMSLLRYFPGRVGEPCEESKKRQEKQLVEGSTTFHTACMEY